MSTTSCELAAWPWSDGLTCVATALDDAPGFVEAPSELLDTTFELEGALAGATGLEFEADDCEEAEF